MTAIQIIAPSSGLATYRTFPEGKPLNNDAVTAMEALGEEWREVLAERKRREIPVSPYTCERCEQ